MHTYAKVSDFGRNLVHGMLNGTTPKVSALVPCYNAEEFIEKTLESLKAQTWPNLEVLIGDDCSTDNTLRIVRDFSKRNDNVRVLAREANLGWIKNTNDLMARASGEFMFFAFHDDIIDPTYVEKLIAELLENPKAVIAYSDMQTFQQDGTMRESALAELSGAISSFRRGMIMVGMPNNWAVPNRGVFKAEAFRIIGGIRPNFQGEFSADWTWLLHMSLIGEFRRVPEVLCWKYFKKNSISRQWDFSIKQKIALKIAGISEIFISPVNIFSKFALVSLLLLNEARKSYKIFNYR